TPAGPQPSHCAPQAGCRPAVLVATYRCPWFWPWRLSIGTWPDFMPCVRTAPERELLAPFAATVVLAPHQPGAMLEPGSTVIVLEAMKMEHELATDEACELVRLTVAVGETVVEGQPLAVLRSRRDADNGAAPAAGAPAAAAANAGAGAHLDREREDLA